LPGVIVAHVRGHEDSVMIVDREALQIVKQEEFTDGETGVLKGYVLKARLYLIKFR
jgi:hypothetical protein